MFGWLAARFVSPCQGIVSPPASRRVCRTTPHALACGLPSLGSVLYLHDSRGVATENLPSGLLVAQRAFAPLLDTRWLIATSMVTNDGPREWCACIDSTGRPRACLYLLPDTDYLAWDALAGSGVSADMPPASLHAAHATRFDSASVVSFRLGAIAGLQILDQQATCRLSALGDNIVARIATAESVVLHK